MELSNNEKIYGLSLLWKEAEYNFAHFDKVPDLNWNKTYLEYIDEVINTKTTLEYYRVLQKFIALLKDGHTNIYLPNEFQENIYYPHLKLQSLNKKIFIVESYDELSENIPIGSEILEVNNISTEEYLNKEVFPYIGSSTEHFLWEKGAKDLLIGFDDTNISIKINTPEGQVKDIVLKRFNLGKNAILKILVPEKRVEFKWLEEDIAHVTINHFADKQIISDFMEYLPQIEKCKGIIIDIRKNLGGSSYTSYEIIKRFTDKSFSSSKCKFPKHISYFKISDVKNEKWYEEKEEVIKPLNIETINVPMVVLISNYTFSAAEDFLVALDSINRATFIGERTGGSTGNSLVVKLPGGGMARICIQEDTFPDGRKFVGYGIEPNIYVHPTLNDIIKVTDTTLDKAVEVIKNQI